MRACSGFMQPAWLLTFVLLSAVSLRAVAAPEADVTGVWTAEPQLGQLGVIQSSYTFNSDGTFQQKADFKSFCGMGAVKPDCEYFWTVSEGTYSLGVDALTLKHEKMTSILKYQGYAEPQRRDMQMRPMTESMQVSFEGDRMTLTDKKGKLHSYSRMEDPAE